MSFLLVDSIQHANDKEFLLASLMLAEKGRYSCKPNPKVGCVLVKDQKVIGEGWHQIAGEGHAEVNAIADAKHRQESTQGATAYVSLEPCSFTGKTPPCVNALLDAGIQRVVCASVDPNPKVAGNGLEKLRSQGVDASVLEDADIQLKAERLNRGFFKRMRTGMPWVMLKTASSIDGRTADSKGHSKWITSEESRQDVQFLRAESDAVLTGSGTQQADNPSLNVRLDALLYKLIKQPYRVLLDSQFQVSVSDNIVGDDEQLIVFTTQDQSHKIKSFADKAQIEVCEIIELENVLKTLATIEVNQLMIEAGPILSGAFLEAGLVDEIIHYIAPSVIGSNGKGMFDFTKDLSIHEKKMFQLHTVKQIENDIKLVYVRKNEF